jgi:hypothetical protein
MIFCTTNNAKNGVRAVRNGFSAPQYARPAYILKGSLPIYRAPKHRHHPRGTGGEADLLLPASPSTRGGATAPWWSGAERAGREAPLGRWVGPESAQQASVSAMDDGVSAMPPGPGILLHRGK